MLGRFYAICDCCSCCCGAMQAHQNGTPMLASSGHVAQVDAGVCAACGIRAEHGQFAATAVAVVPGYSVHEELRLLRGCGLSLYETIKTATVNAGIAAQAMIGTNPVGTIEVGKQADFVLTAKNPLQDVVNVQEMIGVLVQGRWLSKDALDGLRIGVRTVLA